MRLLMVMLAFLLIVASHAVPRGHYSNEYVWNLNGLKECRQSGEPCRRDYDCCGRFSLCRVVPGDEGLFSMKFRCENDGKRFYH